MTEPSLTFAPRLSVVVPTRNRSAQILAFVERLRAQSLPAGDFEVVVVDDGSTPPVDAARLRAAHAGPLRVVRRDAPPSAHDGRRAGARAARAPRVLFLDDDVELHPDLLRAHAALGEQFALGPIFYHREARTTAYHRFRDILYSADAQAIIDRPDPLPLGHMYICNSSGPTARYLDVLDRVAALVSPAPTPGDGCDEALMDIEFQKEHGFATVLAEACAWHRDTKTLRQACDERKRHGEAVCDLVIRHPHLRQWFDLGEVLAGERGKTKALRSRFVWGAPSLFRIAETCLSSFADHGPVWAVPRWLCRAAMGMAYWEGVRSVEPSLSRLRASLGVGAP
jgi:hypothetical protein